jgi:4-diphosphocytidyl-2-C-methyl-D-erythritol kinase
MNDNPSRNIAYRSYAKVNLYLDVLDRRPDGFTNIETIFQTVDLWDELAFAPRDTGTHVTCNLPALSDSQDNLVYRAAELLRAETGATGGVSIHLEKHIPVAAGLAGGSGNAAATLIALNELWALRLTAPDLDALARRLGSDVPYCLVGGTVAATGRGELMEALDPIDPQWLVLVHPPLAITAGHAYGHPRLTRNLETPVDGKTPAFRDAIKRLARGDTADVIFNRMESGVFHDHPELNTIKTRLRDLGATASAMSGSGPTIFGLFPDESTARQAGQAIKDYSITLLQTAAHGVVRQS